MRAVRLHGVGDLRVETIATPKIGQPDEVLLAVRGVGICGSDLHNFRTGRWISRLPVVPGHEFVAEVLEVGAAVTDLAPGHRVVADSRVTCGVCPSCRRGLGNRCKKLGYIGEVCDGGLAEYVVLPRRQLLAIPAHLPISVALLAEPLGVALHVVRRLAAPKDEPIVVAGGGPIGGLALVLLAHFGMGPLYLIERHPERAARLQQAAGSVHVTADDIAITSIIGRGCRHAIDATGSSAVASLLSRVLEPGGRLALVGLFEEGAHIDMNIVVERELELLGCSVYGDEQTEAVALLGELTDRLMPLVAEPVPLEAVPETYESLLTHGSGHLKTHIRPSQPASHADLDQIEAR